VSANRITERLRELLRVIEQADVPPIEFGGHRLRVGHARQGALKHQPIEARENTDDLFCVTVDQVRHRPTVQTG